MDFLVNSLFLRQYFQYGPSSTASEGRNSVSPGKRENSRIFWVFIPSLRGVSKAVGGP